MIRIADIKENDCVNGEGICVSVWMQGCPWHCKGCHNPETWNFNGGRAIQNEEEEINKILKLINKNGVQRNLSLLGGEPLCEQNENFVYLLLKKAKEKFPTIKTFVWTGNILDNLNKEKLQNIDILIDGPFVLSLKDLTLKLRGSSNQRILYKGKDF